MTRPDLELFDTRTAALVLKVGGYPLHHGGVAVIRTLGRVGVRVFGVHEGRRVPAARSAYLTGGFIWRTGGRDEHRRQLLDGMEALAAQIDRPCVVIPTDDHGAVFLNECSGELPACFLQPELPAGRARELVNKRHCLELAQRVGFPVPRTTVLRVPAPVAEVKSVGLPVVVKRAERALLPDGTRSYSTVIARTVGELRQLVEDPVEEHDILLQEVIPGNPGDDWLFHGYCDARSASVVSFTGRKLRSYPAYAGETAYARAERKPELQERVEQLLKTIGFVGVVSMDLRYDRRDGTYKLLDFNPRVGACFRLFENVHGIDVIRALHLDLTGRAVPRGPQRDGRTYIVESYDALTRPVYARHHGLTWGRWLSSLWGADEHAWLAADDLVPPCVFGLRQYVYRRGYPREPAAPQYFAGRLRHA
jgi:D-aspartate ligase